MLKRKLPDLSNGYISRLVKIMFLDDNVFMSKGLGNEFGVTMSSRGEEGLLSIKNCQNFMKDVRRLELSLFLITLLYKECCEEETCVKSEFPLLLRRLEEVGKEVDDLKWKFKLLAGHHVDSVSGPNARFLFQVKHGEEFGEIVFENFLTARLERTRISWSEIEQSIFSLSPELELIRQILSERDANASLTSIRFDPFSEQKGSPSTESLMEDLRVAMESRNTELVDYCLQKLKNQSVSNKLTRSAEQLLLSIRLSQDLRGVMASRDCRKIRVMLDRVRSSSLLTKLNNLCSEAEVLLCRLEKLELLRSKVSDLSSASMAEITSYARPPTIVHSVAKSFLLLLSVPERRLQSWEQCLAELKCSGRDSVKRRLAECQIFDVEKSTARRAKLLISRLTLESVMEVSAGCVVLFRWVQGVLSEVLDKE